MGKTELVSSFQPPFTRKSLNAVYDFAVDAVINPVVLTPST